MPVQWVNRPNLDFRGFSGTISSGRVATGDTVVVARSGRASKVRRIVTMDGDLREAVAGQAVTLVLDDEIDVSCGDVLAPSAALPEVSEQFAAHLLWMAEEDLLPGRQYWLKSGRAHRSRRPRSPNSLKHKVDVNTFDHLAAKTLQLNEVGSVQHSRARRGARSPSTAYHGRTSTPAASFSSTAITNATLSPPR